MLPEIDVISNVVVEGKSMRAIGSREAVWHTDMSAFECPASATINYGAEIPAVSTNTRFANTCAAYETLPRPLKEKVEGRRLAHKAYTAVGNAPEAVHPIIRTHLETGRKALYLDIAEVVTSRGSASKKASRYLGNSDE
ncbi:TauD/TfdA family dioxygenase [Bradyrhizobium sp. SRL28]|nr:TauD/TfdA family dioxygenase [Bradyrhizobium sp. SRL28]